MRKTVAVVTAVSLGLIASVVSSDVAPGPVAKGASADHHTSYPIDPIVVTTAGETVVPTPVPATSPWLYPYQVAEYAQYGYGGWQYGPGLAYEKRVDLMPAGYDGSSVTHVAGLLRFFGLSDVHVADEETPANSLYFGYTGYISSAYAPTMLWTTQVLDAAVQTINALNKEQKFDFGISLGDSINNQQYNEMRWYLDALDGNLINPDSGGKDDPVEGPLNDYQDVFKAAGLDQQIPWYQVMGNHDRFWMGFLPGNGYIAATRTGEEILNLGNIIVDSMTPSPLGANSRGFYMGSIDGRTPYGDIIGVGPQALFATPPKVLAADPNRRAVSRQEFMRELFNSSSRPKGHGFSQSNIDNNFASYTFEPKANLPLKVIVLDVTQGDAEPNVRCYAHLSLDKARYDWLVNELEKGQAEGKLMVIAAHGPVGVPFDPFTGWSTNAYLTEAALLAKLHEYPNLIAWIAGHRHLNAITALPSPYPTQPELGFWVIETASLKHFPQQFRTFEIVRNSDNTISIITTNVDPSVADGSPAATSREYAIAQWQIFTSAYKPGGPKPWNADSRNAELVVPLSPEMRAKIQDYGQKIKTAK
jgi:metallophosphoesterase (TIGR03768 family)